MIRHMAAALLAATMASGARADDRGLVSVTSPFGMDDTVSHLESAIRAKGLKLFAVIDHAGEARAAGLALRPMKLLVVGNPTAGTPLMQHEPTVGIDLPMKLLVWERAPGQVSVTWNDPAYLVRRHELPKDDEATFAAIGNLAAQALKP